MARWFSRDGVVRNHDDALRERDMLWIFCRHWAHATRMDPCPIAHRMGAILFEKVATIFYLLSLWHPNAVILRSTHNIPPR
jgi:hypothetical protein